MITISLPLIPFVVALLLAVKAIEVFHDELIWYFTEYEAMLR